MNGQAKYNPFLTEDVSDWLKSIEKYVTETDVSILDLSCKNKWRYDDGSFDDKTLDIPFEILESVLKYLSNSQVTELRLDFVDFSKKLTGVLPFFKKCVLCELIKNTNIRKLDFGNRDMSVANLKALLDIVKQSNVEDCGEFVFRSFRQVIGLNLVKLNLKIDCEWPVFSSSFANRLPESSLTSLHLIFDPYPNRDPSNVHDIAASIFAKLPHSQIKELDLSFSENGDNLMNALSPNLASSKLETLNVSHCDIHDSGLDVLAQGLVGSKVSTLNLSFNQIKGLNNFGQCVRRTSIKVLNLRYKPKNFEDFRDNGIENRQMFDFPNFLVGSVVESLDISEHNFNQDLGMELINSLKFTNVTKLKISISDQYITEFVKALRETKVEHAKIHLPGNDIEAFGELLKDSNLKSIEFQFNGADFDPRDFIISSLDWIKNCSITSLHLKSYTFSGTDVESIAEAFVGTNITHLSLQSCRLNGFVTFFAPHLKNTSITHLSLQGCQLQDEDVAILAENLKTTKITELNLSWTGISNVGAEALSIHVPGSSIISLDLHLNSIKDDGFEFLANGLSDSLLTTLDGSHNPGRKFLPIQKMLFENRVRAHKLVVLFKQLVPAINEDFCFSQSTSDMSVNDFLEACLKYKTVVEQPAAISVLIKEATVSKSREELISLFDKFPLKFSQFIGNEIEANVWELVELLRKTEELGLNEIVELLLLNRPLYYIDETNEILHPEVYKLMLKYKQPVVNTSIEPAGVAKIIDYFTENTSIDGSADLVNLLKNIKIS